VCQPILPNPARTAAGFNCRCRILSCHRSLPSRSPNTQSSGRRCKLLFQCWPNDRQWVRATIRLRCGTVPLKDRLQPNIEPGCFVCEIRIVLCLSHDRNILPRGILVEAGGKKAIVLKIARRIERTVSDVALRVLQNGFVDLHLVAAGDLQSDSVRFLVWEFKWTK